MLPCRYGEPVAEIAPRRRRKRTGARLDLAAILIGNPTSPTVEEWSPPVLEAHHLRLAALDVGILVAANRLPFHHRDPADRFIIATALRDGLPVVTGDQRFQAYGVRVVC